jgi:hypothetical protein
LSICRFWLSVEILGAIFVDIEGQLYRVMVCVCVCIYTQGYTYIYIYIVRILLLQIFFLIQLALHIYRLTSTNLTNQKSKILERKVVVVLDMQAFISCDYSLKM